CTARGGRGRTPDEAARGSTQRKPAEGLATMRCCAGFTSTLCFLTLALAACSGSQKGAEAPTLTAADPEAIGKMAQAVEAARSRQEVPKAIGLFKQALKADSTLWEARYDLGVLLAQSGELAAAEKHLTQAAELAPNAEDVLV